LISVSRAMLLHPYIVRYEMIEFAVLTLASRSQSLVPLHAACVGLGGNGCLIIGASGTGKSTLCLMALDDDMLVLAEDSAFLDPVSFSIFGVPNYLHAKYEAPNLLAHGRLSDFVSAAPVIRRRSGTLKFEADLRRLGRGIPQSSLRLNATIFLTQQRADIDSVMKPVDRADMIARMNEEQPYAAGLAGWDQVCEKLAEHPCFELQRTDPPAAAVRELRALLA
jgi:hypothetical protein